MQHKSLPHVIRILNEINYNEVTIFLRMDTIFETPRLLLRKFTPDDANLIYELNKDPDVTRFTHDPMHDIRQANYVLTKMILPQYELYGYGRWAVHLKHENEFIGWCGLKYRPELDEIDLGFRFKRVSWGKGYATESALATIAHGFNVLKLTRITGHAEPENFASCKVLENCGMQYIGNEEVDGFSVRTYIINNPSL